MLIWCLKQVIYTVLLFFLLGGGVDVVFVRLLLIKHIIKDANLMGISVSVKYSQTFWES